MSRKKHGAKSCRRVDFQLRSCRTRRETIMTGNSRWRTMKSLCQRPPSKQSNLKLYSTSHIPPPHSPTPGSSPCSSHGSTPGSSPGWSGRVTSIVNRQALGTSVSHVPSQHVRRKIYNPLTPSLVSCMLDNQLPCSQVRHTREAKILPSSHRCNRHPCQLETGCCLHSAQTPLSYVL